MTPQLPHMTFMVDLLWTDRLLRAFYAAWDTAIRAARGRLSGPAEGARKFCALRQVGKWKWAVRGTAHNC